MFGKSIKYFMSFTYPCPRKLREIMKLSLIERETTDRVATIWMDYHKQKPSNVSYCLSKSEWERFYQNSTESPLSLLPLKRNNGHFMMISQAQQKSILFTYLEDYKKSATFSSPYFIMTFFDELLYSKSIVLLRGDIMDNKIDGNEAYFLMNQTIRFYMDPHLYDKYIYNLNRNQQLFDYEQFREEFKLN